MAIKDDVFHILRERCGQHISGSEIASRLGVTRAAVWKAIASLRAEGTQIDATTNRGYCLREGSDRLSEPVIRQYLNHPDRTRICLMELCDSTNNVAKRLAMQGAPDGTLVVAERQESGRGRLGRSFYSPGHGGVYMSVILRPALSAYDAVLITSAAAVAVCRAIQKVGGIEAQIKWVNDIYIKGKKVCGILTEAATDLESGSVEYLIVGIGINARQGKDKIPSELEPIITTIEQHTEGGQVGRCELIASVANELEAISHDLKAATFLEEYRQRSLVLGQTVQTICAGVSETVEVVGIDERAGLVVRTQDGLQKTISSGDVSIRPA